MPRLGHVFVWSCRRRGGIVKILATIETALRAIVHTFAGDTRWFGAAHYDETVLVVSGGTPSASPRCGPDWAGIAEGTFVERFNGVRFFDLLVLLTDENLAGGIGLTDDMAAAVAGNGAEDVAPAETVAAADLRCHRSKAL